MIRRVASLLAVTCALGAGSCIVTDKIEFEDYVNNPPEVILIEPLNTAVQKICKEKQEFTVRVWDPDEGDLARYAAKLKMYSTSIPQERECSVGEYFAPGEQLEEYESGVQVSVRCEFDLEPYQGISEGTLLPFQVQISDLGFFQSEPAEGARTAQVVWFEEVLPEFQCEGNL